MRKALASLSLATMILGGGTAACTTAGTGSGYVDEVQYGYYDSGHHYHPYAHPVQKRVTVHEYQVHKYEYQPHGSQHRVTIHHTTTTTTTHHGGSGLTKSTTTRRTTTHTTTHSTTSRRR